MPQHHVSRTRGSDFAPRSVQTEGRFGRMFRNLPSFVPEVPGADQEARDRPLRDLAAMMVEPPEQQGGAWQPSGTDLDGDIPAGYTYLGQFIDHDITFDPVSNLQRQNDPDGLHNFRTPRFDLDSLYGAGPNNAPFMYDPDDGIKLLVGDNGHGDRDLPRNLLPSDTDGHPRGRALIGDARNDENTIVSQLHLLFIRFHNAVVDLVRGEQPGLSNSDVFDEAQRVVRWHYQWIVVHDFLPRIVGPEVVADILRPSGNGYAARGAVDPVAFPEIHLRFFGWRKQPFMPVEFSVAAYRFGHSMIRPSYKINPAIGPLPIFSDQPNPSPTDDFHGFRPLPGGWKVDWNFFFESDDQTNMQVARRIDAHLSLGTFNLPGESDVMKDLAFRNLRRGRALGLPSGQRVARAMAIEPLDDDQLGIAGLSDVFVGNAPLWFYVLQEAEALGQGKLGPVGGRIVAEVLLGLLKGDPLSYINVEPTWKPTVGTSGDFSMRDLVAFVGG